MCRSITPPTPSLTMRRKSLPARSSGHDLTTLTPYLLAHHPKTSTGCNTFRTHWRGLSWNQTRNVSTKNLLSTLHWLPVRRRIDFKIAVLTYKLLSTGQPSCLACKITPYVSGRRLRSSESGTLSVPRNCCRFACFSFSGTVRMEFNSSWHSHSTIAWIIPC